MSKRTRRIWTDDELGYVEDTMDRPQREVAAHLNRPIHSVADMRGAIRGGWTRKLEVWTEEEDAVILANPNFRNEELSARLPGRTPTAVSRRRIKIQENKRDLHSYNPFAVGGRPLLAKTCRKCGRILPGMWFGFGVSHGIKCYSSHCRECSNKQTSEREKKKKRHLDKRARAYVEKAQAITIPLAEMKGQPWTEADHKILADPSLTLLAKALITRRTYSGAATTAHKSGYKSRQPIGDPERDQWIIDNPNVDRIEEITAMLNQPEPTTPTRPDFEWDD